jgi:hypothetical protein
MEDGRWMRDEGLWGYLRKPATYNIQQTTYKIQSEVGK